MSAYCSFKYNSDFFGKYFVGDVKRNRAGPSRATSDELEEVKPVSSQLLTKSLLSILKHKNLGKTAEKCELTILEGSQTDGEPNEKEDSLESRLIVRLHCKHGVIKTHRLLLNTPTSNFVPMIPHAPTESRISVSPQTVQEIVEHFPHSKGPKSDPQLIWKFDLMEVKVKSMENAFDPKGKAQLATELTVGADDFDIYEVHSPPTTIGFHLREFNATIAFAESSSLSLELRFTEPADPLFISTESDDCQILFIISTFQVRGENGPADGVKPAPSAGSSNARKREREDDGAVQRKADTRKSTKVVQKAGSALPDQSNSDERYAAHERFPSASAPLPHSALVRRPNEPLFLPGSQLSAAEAQVLRESGLGDEGMDADDFAAMLEGEGEEVGLGVWSQAMETENDGPPAGENAHADDNADDNDSFDIFEEECTEVGPTQVSGTNLGEKAFRPLFED